MEENCRVLQRANSRTIIASCDVDFGASGAPIFSMKDGQPKVVSVVSAKGNGIAGDVTLGVALGDALAEMQAELARDTTVFQRKKPGKSLAEQLGR